MVVDFNTHMKKQQEKRKGIFSRRDRQTKGVSARDAGIVLTYYPRNREEESVIINGMTITQAGVAHVGQHPELHKWVNKVLRVEVKVNKETPDSAKSKKNALPRNATMPTRSNKYVSKAVPTRRGGPPAAIDVINSVRQEEVELLKGESVQENPESVLAPVTEEFEAVAPEVMATEKELDEVAPFESDFEAPAASEVLSGVSHIAVENSDTSVDPSSEVLTVSKVREQFKTTKELKVFASEFKVKARGYENTINRLVEMEHVALDQVEDTQVE